MKKSYYVNKVAQYNGDHEVHLEACPKFPKPENRLYLGAFDTCLEAVREAKKFYTQSNGCIHCVQPCHTS
ncbi:hypothetical protein [Paraflavitalea pollutisoli]|uniref:hypothetical protein n=1 Tax=Paraflavitalea pollutisoli TaxID=3034143 RepID=UPI0023EC427F|nr:hypothetical protein [Paraflavitalea sp. H1-2-19X]